MLFNFGKKYRYLQFHENNRSPHVILMILRDEKTENYLARRVRHVTESHSQLVITKIRTEHVIIAHICT